MLRWDTPLSSLYVIRLTYSNQFHFTTNFYPDLRKASVNFYKLWVKFSCFPATYTVVVFYVFRVVLYGHTMDMCVVL